MIVNKYSKGGSGSGSTYVLPTATAERLGGVKVGDGLSIDANGVLSSEGGAADAHILLPSSALPQSVIWDEYQANTFKLIRQVVGNNSPNYIVEWGNGKYAIVSASDNVLSYGSDWVENDGVYTFTGATGDSNLTSWEKDGKIYFKHTEEVINFGQFGSDNPKEGGIETDGDENGSVRATTNGVYQLVNDEWRAVGGNVLPASSETPEGLQDGDVYALASGSTYGIYQKQNTRIKVWEPTTGAVENWTQFRVPKTGASESSVQAIRSQVDLTDLWWHPETNPQRWDYKANDSIYSTGATFTYTDSDTGYQVTAVEDGDYVVVTFQGGATYGQALNETEFKMNRNATIYRPAVMSDTIFNIWKGTQSDYDELVSESAISNSTLYIII